jgi:hypothetical protein
MTILKKIYRGIIAFIKWITLAENLKEIYKWLDITKVLLGGKKTEKLLAFIDKTQKSIDNITGKVENKEVDNMVKIINGNDKGFEGITATLKTNKHGEGNHGIDLKIDTKYLDLTWDPTNGEVKFGLLD